MWTNFSRNGTGWRVGNDFQIATYSANAARVLDGAVLVERQGVNALFDSRNLQGAGWTVRGAPVAQQGDWFVVSLGPEAAGGIRGVVQSGRSAGNATVWAIIKPGTVSRCLLTMGDSTNVDLEFDADTHEIFHISGHVDGYGIERYPDGSCFAWMYADGTGYPSGRSSGISINPVGKEGDTLKVFAAQHEPYEGSPSSLIPTAQEQKTRAADFIDAPTGVWYLPGEATFRGAARCSRDPGQPVLLATDGGIRIYQDDGALVLDGPGELVTDKATYAPGELMRFAWMLEAPDVARYTIGRDYDDSHWWNSHVLDLNFQERRITPAQARAELGVVA